MRNFFKCPECGKLVPNLEMFGTCTYSLFKNEDGSEYIDDIERAGEHRQANCPKCDHRADIEDFDMSEEDME